MRICAGFHSAAVLPSTWGVSLATLPPESILFLYFLPKSLPVLIREQRQGSHRWVISSRSPCVSNPAAGQCHVVVQPQDQLSASDADPPAPSLSEHPAHTADPSAELPREKHHTVSPIWNETPAGSSWARRPVAARELAWDEGPRWANWLRTGNPREALEEAWAAQGRCHSGVRLVLGEGRRGPGHAPVPPRDPTSGLPANAAANSHLLSSSHAEKYLSPWHVANILSWC